LVVNNAGVMPLSPMEALKADEWDRMIDVNVRGVLQVSPPHCPRCALRAAGTS
jgi:NADP-dependent 3-hydroxy acid dehydrogenase YdfG